MPLKTKNPPLQRGSACLCCRKRKMRCDGVRPSCSQCVKANRAETCDFEDRHRKSRTHTLQERLLSLERKLRKLEDQSPTPPHKTYQQVLPAHTQLYSLDNVDHEGIRPDATLMANFPTLIFDSVAPSNFLTAFEPFEGSPEVIPEFIFDFLQPRSPSRPSTPTDIAQDGKYGNGFQTPSSSLHKIGSPQPIGMEPFSPSCEQELLAIFLAHYHQCNFEVDTDRLRSLDWQPHPALLNAIYLSACYFSQSPWFAGLENHFYVQTLNAINTGLEHADRLIDIASASCLVAVYQYANGRISEGYRHSFAAARLAIDLGLHQIPGIEGPSRDSAIPHLGDSKDIADRINVFWQVYGVDRAWSVANELPTALPSDHPSGILKIETQLPPPSVLGTPSIPALRAQAVTLYERAYRVSSSFLEDDVFRAERRVTGQALDHFSSTVPPFLGADPRRRQPPGIDVDLFTIHAMINVAYIYLQRDHLGKCMPASKLCLKAAHTVSSHIRQLKEEDYPFLHPIIGACWKTVGMLYTRLIVANTKSSIGSNELQGVTRELGVVVFALKKLGSIFPIAGQYAAMLEQERERC